MGAILPAGINNKKIPHRGQKISALCGALCGFMQENQVKPQLHSSHLSLLYRCGEKFRRIVLLGEYEPPRTPLIIGTAAHAVIAKNLTNKIEKGTLLTKEAVQDFSRDEFVRNWHESPVIFTDEEVEVGVQKVRDQAQDVTVQLVTAHHYQLAPKIQPKAVERKWVLEAPGFPYDLAGTIDIDEDLRIILPGDVQWKTESSIRDTKTRKTNLGIQEVERSEQYTLYAMAKYFLDGKLPDFVVQDNLIKPTKTREAYAISYSSTRTLEDFKVFNRRFEQACKIIEREIFTPANPQDWWCSKDFCGFAATGDCPYFNSKRSLTVLTTNETKQGGKTDGPNNKNTSSNIIAGLEDALDA